jgi:hypothetical protein
MHEERRHLWFNSALLYTSDIQPDFAGEPKRQASNYHSTNNASNIEVAFCSVDICVAGTHWLQQTRKVD